MQIINALEEHLVKMHLPDWQFYLPWGMGQWDTLRPIVLFWAKQYRYTIHEGSKTYYIGMTYEWAMQKSDWKFGVQSVHTYFLRALSY